MKIIEWNLVKGCIDTIVVPELDQDVCTQVLLNIVVVWSAAIWAERDDHALAEQAAIESLRETLDDIGRLSGYAISDDQPIETHVFEDDMSTRVIVGARAYGLVVA